MKFFTPEVWRGTEEGTVLSFETIDLDGKPVDSKALFAQNKVTMINIWGTTCGPCINEMPELEEMNKEFQQKGGAIVGLVDDVWVSNMKYLDEAKEIVNDTGVTFTNLCAWDGYNDVLSAVGTPTTYFVDSNGKILGDPILGASPDKYRERMEEYLAQAK
jgi:thiol-disulfide isomerase/thioredoxin